MVAITGTTFHDLGGTRFMQGVDTVALWPFGQSAEEAVAALRLAAAALDLAGVGD